MNVLDTFQLKGRRALITGSSAGIGLALAEASQLNGWLGQFLDRVGERLQAGQAEWREQVPIHDEGSRRELW